MKWIYRNAVPDATIRSSSNAIGYGPSMLNDRSPRTKLKFTGKTDEYITFDLGSALPVSAIGIFGHNITTGATITLEAHTADTWATPSFSQALTFASPLTAFFTEQTYRYWRLRIQNASNPNNLEIGLVYLGLSIEVASITPDATIDKETMDVSNISRSGEVYGFNILQRYAPSFNLYYVSDATRQALLTVYAEQSTVEPFILLVWEDSLDVVPPLYGVFTMAAFSFKRLAQSGLGYSTSFSFRETF